jgi:hypothetical protein
MPNYNTMGLAKASLEAATRYLAFCLGPQGIRANAISAGPIKTLAASGIGNFGKLLAYNAHHAPLRRNVTIEEVGNAAAFMLSDLASGITGEIMYVDGGTEHHGAGQRRPAAGLARLERRLTDPEPAARLCSLSVQSSRRRLSRAAPSRVPLTSGSVLTSARRTSSRAVPLRAAT